MELTQEEKTILTDEIDELRKMLEYYKNEQIPNFVQSFSTSSNSTCDSSRRSNRLYCHIAFMRLDLKKKI